MLEKSLNELIEFNKSINSKRNVSKKVIKTILFTDVKGSSKMWSKSETDMSKVLEKHFEQVDILSKKYNGMVIKTLGDSFMVCFDLLIDGIKFSIDLQKQLQDNPFNVDGVDFKIRIGLASGEMYERETIIQNKNLKDYFGNIVNTASRLESVVSEVGGFAFAFKGELQDKKQVEKIISDLKLKNIDYEYNCNVSFKRSSRLLSQRHNVECDNVSELHGVKPILVYSVKPPIN